MKVYVSSTYQDLVDHRNAVDRTLRRMGRDVIGMEQYVAEGSKPVERCKADVRAADAYVIIVAWRFGYVPVSTACPPDRRSITEIELDEASQVAAAVSAQGLTRHMVDRVLGEPPWPARTWTPLPKVMR
jgi:hypothetical protein